MRYFNLMKYNCLKKNSLPPCFETLSKRPYEVGRYVEGNPFE